MAAISTWSTTAASNNSAAPDGWPEGMAPSGVNDSARELMAAVRTQFQQGIWFDWGDTPTRTADTTFTISGDVTSRYTVGRTLRSGGSSTVYHNITVSSYGAPDTTVTVDGTLPATLSSVSLSLQDPGDGVHVSQVNLLDKTATETVSGAWTFSANVTVLKSGPSIVLDNTLSPADEGQWRMFVEAATGDFGIATYTDAPAFGAYAIRAARTGTTVDTITLAGTTIALTGTTIALTGAVVATSYDGVAAADLVSKSAAETISGIWSFDGTLRVGGTTPRFYLDDSDAGADEKVWEFVTDANGSMLIRSDTDLDAAGSNAIKIDRTGTTIDQVTLTATEVQLDVTTFDVNATSALFSGTVGVTGALSLTTKLAVAEGGTGASTAAAARTNLGIPTIYTGAVDSSASPTFHSQSTNASGWTVARQAVGQQRVTHTLGLGAYGLSIAATISNFTAGNITVIPTTNYFDVYTATSADPPLAVDMDFMFTAVEVI